MSSESSLISAVDLSPVENTTSEFSDEVTLLWRNLSVIVEKKRPKAHFWSRQDVEHQTILDSGKKKFSHSYIIYVFFF